MTSRHDLLAGRSGYPPALVLCALLTSGAAGSAQAQTWEDLEARQATIAGIEIVVSDVFDVTQPTDNTWIGRAANALHVRTRQGVVWRELLFSAGDRVDARRIRETERNLRRYSFIRDARITPIRESADSVRARVEIVDAWSLRTSGSLRREGGRTAWSASLDEVNLLGRGKRLAVARARTRERSTSAVSYTDPQVLDSRWVVALSHAGLSDGVSRFAAVERPFFSLETPYAVGGSVTATEYVLTQYDHAEPIYVMATRRTAAALHASRAFVTPDRTAFRVGVRYDAEDTTFGPALPVASSALPAPSAFAQRFRGLSVAWSVVQDRSATFRNLASIAQPEDYSLGWLVSGRVGSFASRLGSTRSAPFGAADVRKGWRAGRGLLLAGAGIRGRREAGAWRDAAAHLELTAYHQRRPWHTLAANVHLTAVAGPEPDDRLYLDSAAGLRGYADHFLAGDQRVVASMDSRIITEWRLLGLLQVGFVAYADAGAIRRLDTGSWSRLYANVGGGLRFGSLRGARHNILQASLATPLVREPGLDRLFLVLGNTVRF